jgi:hypothetical protein
MNMLDLYQKAARVYFAAATVALMLFAFAIFGSAILELVTTIAAEDPIAGLIDSIGLLIIGFAIIETAKFVAEEELFRQRELRSVLESRRSLTKFITIIVIVATLESLMMIFKVGREDIPASIYPAVLFVAAMFALIALGLYQWLSSRVASPGSETKSSSRARER